MNKKLSRKFYLALVLFSLVGQVAWVVENMYFNVFIYKMFHASASQISLMVAMSAITAALTTIFIGALSDKIGTRKAFIVAGYILWGISILAFGLIRIETMTKLTHTEMLDSIFIAARLGCILTIILDCVMTFFGSSANDAAFNAWLTDKGNDSNRGSIEGINAMMPLLAILVVFGSFMSFNLDSPDSWTTIYFIIGGVVICIGILGIFLIDDSKVDKKQNEHYFANIIYGFRPSTIKQNKLLYSVLVAYSIFNISIQVFMPYLILYYEKSLGLTNYVLIMAPAIIIAAVITFFYGKLYDKVGFESSVFPITFVLLAGYAVLFLFKDTVFVFIGSLLMMTGYLSGMAVYGAMIRDQIPSEKTGQYQGLRIVAQVLIPGVIGPYIGAFVLRNAMTVENSDGTTSFIPNEFIYLAAFIVGIILLVSLYYIARMRRTAFYLLQTKTEFDETPFPKYPRPMLKRDSFFSLNGDWDVKQVLKSHQNVTVPFPLESINSGLGGFVGHHITYTKRFTLPEGFIKNHVLLHFGAVDQIADVYVDDIKVGHNEGGYLPFTVDITDAVMGENGLDGYKEHKIVVEVLDTLSHIYPYGKQKRKRGGMWYTPVTGIWQSVWMESVPNRSIHNIKLTPTLNTITIEIESKAKDFKIQVYEKDSNTPILETETINKKITLSIPNPHTWTPEDPYLYDLIIKTNTDEVSSYFALRTIEIKEINGKQRILLNQKPIFFHGVLDQGYFPEGIFLPNSEVGYDEDIHRMKELGINTLRKHIKVEPECFYEACDRLGIIVFQDMVNNGNYNFLRDTAMPTLGKSILKDKHLHRLPQVKAEFERNMVGTLNHLYNHPCIVYYTIFNEGWGQFEADRMYEIAKETDPTRILDATSGWFWQEKSDVVSRHVYFHGISKTEYNQPIIVSEFGGYSFLEPGHSYSKYNNYGYGNYANHEELTKAMENLYDNDIIPYIEKGLCGSILTQLCDVEDETNGLYTYDRKICKVDKESMRKIAKRIEEAYKTI